MPKTLSVLYVRGRFSYRLPWLIFISMLIVLLHLLGTTIWLLMRPSHPSWVLVEGLIIMILDNKLRLFNLFQILSWKLFLNSRHTLTLRHNVRFSYIAPFYLRWSFAFVLYTLSWVGWMDICRRRIFRLAGFYHRVIKTHYPPYLLIHLYSALVSAT